MFRRSATTGKGSQLWQMSITTTTRRSTARRGTPPRRRRRSSPTSRRSPGPPTSPTRSRCSTWTRTRPVRLGVGFTELPHLGDELHHFGWNACSSALHPGGGHDHGGRRYLVVPGIRSSRVNILDTEPDPGSPAVIKVLDADELGKRAGYSRPHTVHCGPGARVHVLPGRVRRGGPRRDRPARPEHVRRASAPWEADRGDQFFAYDVWWHVMADVAITSEWGTPAMIEDGVVPELLLGRKYGHRLHFWDMKTRKLTPDRRPRRPAPDGARAAAGARPDQEVRLRRRRGQRRGPVRLDLDVARGQRPVGRAPR